MRKTILICILFMAVGAAASDSDYEFPVRGPVDLSSSFCEFRPLHFHGGIDIRTGGEIGREVYSPVNGYVWRIRYSYTGYGKALYIKDYQGFIYVFGHLSALNNRMEKIVREIQLSNKSYCFDKEYKRDEIPVTKGELIALSGQTGFGAPHIHFEKRTPDNVPLNPLTNGFSLADPQAPEFEGIGFVCADQKSLFENGKRRMITPVKYDWTNHKYYLNEVFYLNSPFGIMIDAGDRIRQNGPRLNLYGAKLYIDDILYYDVNYEKYDYAQTGMVDLSFDYHLTVTDNKYWHLLFNPTGKNYDGAKSDFSHGGIFEANSRHGYGLHTARIEISDARGNSSEVSFDFYYSPVKHIYKFETINDSTLYLRRDAGSRDIPVREIDVLITGRKGWQSLTADRVKPKGNDNFEIDLSYLPRNNGMIRVDVVGENGWSETDNFYSLRSDDKYSYSFDYALLDGGIAFNVKAKRKNSPAPLIEIEYSDGYTAVINTTEVSSNRYGAFYSNFDIRTMITHLRILDPRSKTPVAGVETSISPAGNHLDRQAMMIPDGFRVEFDSSDFYQQSYIEIARDKGKHPYPKNRVTPVYEVGPNTMPLAGDIDVSFKLDNKIDKSNIGLYRLNKKNEWKWVNSTIKGDRISCESSLLGIFTVIADRAAPKISKVYPPNGKTVFTPNPRIRCVIKDGLSDLDRCGDIDVYLDGRWQIPEFDFETNILHFFPDKPLETGRHDMVIKARDRVGNERIYRSHFFVSDKK